MTYRSSPKDKIPDGGIWQHQAPFVLVVLLVLIIIIFTIIGSGLTMLVSAFTGIDIINMLQGWDESPGLSERNLSRTILGINHLMAFCLPAVAFGWFVWRSRWENALHFGEEKINKNLLFSMIFMIGLLPVVAASLWINQQIPLPHWMDSLEDQSNNILTSLMTMEYPSELGFNILVMALLPAIGEEMVFRGLIQQLIQKTTRSVWLGIIITAILFSAFHFQFEGFIPRFILGGGLGLLFYWTSSLWIPIIAHFLFNAMQISAVYFSADFTVEQEILPVFENPPYLMGLIGIVILLIAGRQLIITNKPHLTNEQLLV